MKREKKIILPKMYSGGENGDKPWFIYFSVHNDLSEKMHRFRIYDGFVECKKPEDKINNGNKLIDKYTKKLLQGWNPFDDDSKTIYADQLSYKNAADNRNTNIVSKRSMRAVFNEYLEHNKLSLAKATYQKYQSQFRIFTQFLKDKNINPDIAYINEKTARAFFIWLLEKRKLTGRSLNQYKILMNCVWKDFVKKNPGVKNPWADIAKFKQFSIPQKPLARGVIELIKSDLAVTDPQLWLASQFMYYCFIRPKEMRSLKIKNIDFFEGKISLHGDITKNSRTRVVQIPSVFLNELISDVKLNKHPEDYYVFTLTGSPGTHPVGKNYFWNHFENVRKRLELPRDYKFYGFKHTGAVSALKSGADMHTIKNQMGHSSIATTEEYLKNKTGYESTFFKDVMPKL